MAGRELEKGAGVHDPGNRPVAIHRTARTSRGSARALLLPKLNTGVAVALGPPYHPEDGWLVEPLLEFRSRDVGDHAVPAVGPHG